MARIPYLEITTSPSKSQANLQTLQQKLGTLPNIFKSMAHSPAALQTYMGVSGALGDSSLSPALREAIALAVAEFNGCDYCLAAHSTIGAKAGLSAEDLLSSRQFSASDAKTNAALKLTKALLSTKGKITDSDLQAARQVGITDGELGDICAVIALNQFTNFFNNLNKTDVDFPLAPSLQQAA